VKQKRVGIVLKSFEDVVGGVKQMLETGNLEEFRRNVTAQNNRAIFEIPEILAKLLSEPTATDGNVAGRAATAQESVTARN
jgi:1,2-diacylglycerol 3-beta-galactosyltransferase